MQLNSRKGSSLFQATKQGVMIIRKVKQGTWKDKGPSCLIQRSLLPRSKRFSLCRLSWDDLQSLNYSQDFQRTSPKISANGSKGNMGRIPVQANPIFRAAEQRALLTGHFVSMRRWGSRPVKQDVKSRLCCLSHSLSYSAFHLSKSYVEPTSKVPSRWLPGINYTGTDIVPGRFSRGKDTRIEESRAALPQSKESTIKGRGSTCYIP